MRGPQHRSAIFLTDDPSCAYIAVNDLPKPAGLQRLFAGRYRATAVLVGSRE